MNRVDPVLRPLRSRGGHSYLGEPVTQVEHACQTAALAQAAGAPDPMIVAALLHDVGWLVGGRPGGEFHAEQGAGWLAAWFGPEVTGPVAGHVSAKRFLCATDPGYRAGLSPASQRSLAIQGGPMSPREAGEWWARPGSPAAVALRRWDDQAKVPGATPPDLDRWVGVVERVLETEGARN